MQKTKMILIAAMMLLLSFLICFPIWVISMNVNLDHIKAICKKPMEKVPKGLSEYGITTEEVEKMFVAFCKQK